jgi:hypothetical protein
MGDESTDQGCDMLTACKRWRAEGLAGHKIEAFAGLNPRRIDELKLSISSFGSANLGFNLPLSAQDQKRWEIDDSNPSRSRVGSWGGHCVTAVKYNDSHVGVVSWGVLLEVSWPFVLRYMDEAYALLSPDWMNGEHSPAGLDIATLRADLRML